MFVCGPCHGKCPVEHSALSFGPCEVCGKEAMCRDCVSGHPVTKEELAEYERKVSRWREANRAMYLGATQVEYPRRKE
jgi:hypothetical protein